MRVKIYKNGEVRRVHTLDVKGWAEHGWNETPDNRLEGKATSPSGLREELPKRGVQSDKPGWGGNAKKRHVRPQLHAKKRQS